MIDPALLERLDELHRLVITPIPWEVRDDGVIVNREPDDFTVIFHEGKAWYAEDGEFTVALVNAWPAIRSALRDGAGEGPKLCWVWFDKRGNRTANRFNALDPFDLAAAKREEREACAKVCWGHVESPPDIPEGPPDDYQRGYHDACDNIAAAIRARADAETRKA